MKKRILFISLSFLLFSCHKREYQIENLNNGKILKLGHGGMGFGDTYPMNSAESIKQCLNYPMDGTEIDVQMTRDNVLVAFHDEKLNGKTNLTGIVNDYSWEELRTGKYIVSPHVQYDIVRLDELFSGLDAENFVFALDLKLYTNGDHLLFLETFKNALLQLIEGHTDPAKIIIESQDTVLLNMVRAEKPAYRLFYYPSSFEEGLSTCLFHHYTGITISTRSISKEQVAAAHQSGLQVALWNTHSKRDNHKAILKNPDIIETDRVEYLSRILN